MWIGRPSRPTTSTISAATARPSSRPPPWASTHRWDAEDAHGIAHPIDDALARDGIDEMLMMFREDPAYDNNRDRRHGQTILLREERGPGRWLVSFDPSGITTSPDNGPADVTVTGTASDLWLFIMGRRWPAEMHIEGDEDLAASWGALAGRF